MIANLRSAAAAIAFLLCCSIPFSNATPIGSSSYIPVEQDDYIIIMFEIDGTMEHQKNSSVGKFLRTRAEITTTCAVQGNQTNNTEPIDGGFLKDGLTSSLFDEGRVLGLLLHLHI
jgi:hypothetical protein